MVIKDPKVLSLHLRKLSMSRQMALTQAICTTAIDRRCKPICSLTTKENSCDSGNCPSPPFRPRWRRRPHSTTSGRPADRRGSAPWRQLAACTCPRRSARRSRRWLRRSWSRCPTSGCAACSLQILSGCRRKVDRRSKHQTRAMPYFGKRAGKGHSRVDPVQSDKVLPGDGTKTSLVFVPASVKVHLRRVKCITLQGCIQLNDHILLTHFIWLLFYYYMVCLLVQTPCAGRYGLWSSSRY